MVLADVGNNGKRRSQDVGGVESSAEPGLNDRDIYLLAGEVVQCESGNRLKEGDFFFTSVTRCRSTKRITACLVIGTPFTFTRSRYDTRCGEVNKPTL